MSRRRWVDANLASVRDLTDALAARIGGDGRPRLPLARRGEPGAGGRGRRAPRFASRHVLGQYEYPLLGGHRPPRPAVPRREHRMRPRSSSRPIPVSARLDRPPRGDPLGPVRGGAVAARLRRRPRPDPPRRVADAGSPPVRSSAARRRMARSDPRKLLARAPLVRPAQPAGAGRVGRDDQRVQAVMASIEGYAEHVMDAAGDELGPAVRRCASGSTTGARTAAPRTAARLAVRLRAEAPPVRGGQALLRRRRRRGRDRRPERRLGRPGRASGARRAGAPPTPGRAGPPAAAAA